MTSPLQANLCSAIITLIEADFLCVDICLKKLFA